MLKIENLVTQFATRNGVVRAVNGVSFTVGAGEIVGLVGESGSGKSVTVRSIMGLVRPPGRVVGGSVLLGGIELIGMKRRELRRIRGVQMGFVGQSPFAALNPILSIQSQFRNVVRAHRRASTQEAAALATEKLAAVRMPGVERVLKGHAHELSGGMAQRVVIALAMLLDPPLLIADEPTTALDVTVQRDILELLRDLITSGGRSMLIVTHDLGVVAQYCENVVVMYAGKLVEQGPVADVFRSPAHPYTRALLDAAPRPGRPLVSMPGGLVDLIDYPKGCPYAARCARAHSIDAASRRRRQFGSRMIGRFPVSRHCSRPLAMPMLRVEDVRKTFQRRGGPPIRALNGVSFSIEEGETLGLIGESGSGKSTAGRIVLGLLTPDSGRVEFAGQDIAALSAKQLRQLRAQLQVIFQEPFELLDPRMRIGSIVEEPLIVHRRDLSRPQRVEAVLEMLDLVGLNETHAARYPGELSGGQQQRVGIARAIVTRPRFVVLDEPTSSLDLSIRASILELLGNLQREFGLSYLFISHDIATVRYFCARTAVMYLGKVVEIGDTEKVLATPRHPYTRALLSAALSPDPGQRTAHMPLRGDAPGATKVPSGCPLVGRCPIEIDICSRSPIPLEAVAERHDVACIRAREPVAT